MRGDSTHIIEKLTVEVNVPGLSEGYRVKDNVAAFVDRYVIPAVERYLENLEQDVPPGRILRIDRLQIELETASRSLEDSGGISADVSFVLEEAFEKSLQEIRREQLSLVVAGDLPSAAWKPEAGMPPEDSERPQLTTLRPSARMIEALLHFLEHGTRTWWINDPEELDALLSGKVLKDWEPSERAQLADAVKRKLQSPLVRQRMVRQMTDEALIAILQSAGEKSTKGEKQLRLVEAFLRLLEKEARIPVSVRTREQIWELLFSILPGVLGRQLLSPAALLARMERKLPADYAVIRPEKLVLLARTFIRLAESFSGEHFPEPEVKALAAAFAAEKIPEQKAGSAETVKDARKDEHPAGEEEEERNPEASGRREQEKRSEEEPFFEPAKALTGEAIYVDNAGLVLVHPFLKHLFLNTGQLDGDRFIDPVLAVHMLHYLATGNEEAYEHEMLFEKYIIGIPQEESIPRMVPLGEALREEIGNLLDAVKENWPEMKQSSHEAIRETFLQRSGKLIPEEPQPRLVVERKTVDILMNQLGWTISILRFPWKEEILYVEW